LTLRVQKVNSLNNKLEAMHLKPITEQQKSKLTCAALSLIISLKAREKKNEQHSLKAFARCSFVSRKLLSLKIQ
jgi:hypothetical protein